MTLEEIRPGLILRVINSHGLGAPVGSLTTVKAVETSRSGDWVCIVEYNDKRQPRHGTRLYRSHLWESDLRRFEIVNETEKVVPSTGVTPRLPASWRKRGLGRTTSVHPDQLSLFPADDF